MKGQYGIAADSGGQEKLDRIGCFNRRSTAANNATAPCSSICSYAPSAPCLRGMPLRRSSAAIDSEIALIDGTYELPPDVLIS